MPDNGTSETVTGDGDPVVNMYWRIAGSTAGVTPSDACRAGALGMQVAGLDEFGVISPELARTADALDALREAVGGCGKPFNLDVRMESDVCVSTNRHCVSCKQAMWKAISYLLGTTDNGGVDG